MTKIPGVEMGSHVYGHGGVWQGPTERAQEPDMELCLQRPVLVYVLDSSDTVINLWEKGLFST